MAKSTCRFCDNAPDIGELCRACYSSINYWRKRTPTELVERQDQLEKFQRRMEFLLGNVRHAGRKRRKKAASASNTGKTGTSG